MRSMESFISGMDGSQRLSKNQTKI